ARALLAPIRPERMIFDVTEGRIAPELAFGAEPRNPREPGTGSRARGFSTPRFETMSWTADAPLSLARFQA
ncbi:hypothetical protein, partial [Klebsiella oxytoca]|uniref:hypothetical protein n=1 Tax=Klebsiella oxytoca TaxID=571 RepID=UPI0019542D33